jgi:hypothetical protein
MLEALECRTLLSAHFPAGVFAEANSNPFQDSLHAMDRKADFAPAPSGLTPNIVDVGTLPPRFEIQPSFVVVPDANSADPDAGRVFVVSINAQPLQGDQDASGNPQTSNSLGSAPLWPTTIFLSPSPVPGVSVTASNGYTGWNVDSRNVGSPPSTPTGMGKADNSEPAIPPTMPKLATAAGSGVISSGPMQSPAVGPPVASPVAVSTAQTAQPLAIRPANNPILETGAMLDSQTDRIAAESSLPAVIGPVAQTNFHQPDKSLASDAQPSGFIAAAARIAPEISLGVACNQSVWGLAQGLSSVGGSAGMIETLLIADASALARVANSAADRINLEDAMVWKEMAAFLGGGILIGAYAVRSRQMQEIDAKRSIRRKTICVGEFPR